MSLATLTGQYTGLNGLSGGSFGFGNGYSSYGGYGYNGYGYGTAALYNGANKEAVKDNMATSYELNANSGAYSNKPAVDSSSFSQRCQTIQHLLKEGRTGEAMSIYNQLYKEMESNAHYEGYDANSIRTLLQEQYITATGSSIVNDISTYGKSSFAANFEGSIPLAGLLCESTSRDSFVSKVTGTEQSNTSKVKSVMGAAAGTAVSGGIGAMAGGIIGGMKGKSGRAAILGAVVGAGTSLVTSIVGKFVKAK